MRNTVRLVLLVLCLSFSATGAGLIVMGVAAFSSAKHFESMGDDATAVITDISLPHKRVMVEYSYRGETFKRTLLWYSSSMYEGQKIPIHVNPEDPTRISNPGGNTTAASERTTGTVLICIGVLTIFICALVPAFFLRRKYKRAKLLKEGTAVRAHIIGVRENSAFTVNGQSPLILECSWTDRSGTTYVFRSPNLYEDPRAVLEANGITELPVYFDPENMKNYLVDMSVLDKYSKGKVVHL